MSLLSTIKERISGSGSGTTTGGMASMMGNLGSNQQGALMQAVAGLISSSGGLSGLLSKFNQNGLGQHVQSWVGKGENMPISGDHVQQVFGEDQIRQVAEQTGTDPSHASNLIAGVLPHIVDKLTPHGTQVSDADAHQGMSGLLSGGLGSLFGRK